MNDFILRFNSSEFARICIRFGSITSLFGIFSFISAVVRTSSLFETIDLC